MKRVKRTWHQAHNLLVSSKKVIVYISGLLIDFCPKVVEYTNFYFGKAIIFIIYHCQKGGHQSPSPCRRVTRLKAPHEVTSAAVGQICALPSSPCTYGLGCVCEEEHSLSASHTKSFFLLSQEISVVGPCNSVTPFLGSPPEALRLNPDEECHFAWSSLWISFLVSCRFFSQVWWTVTNSWWNVS